MSAKNCEINLLKAVQDNNSSAQFWMTKKNYFLSADFQANPTDISWQKVVFSVIQNYALLFLSWTAFSDYNCCPTVFLGREVCHIWCSSFVLVPRSKDPNLPIEPTKAHTKSRSRVLYYHTSAVCEELMPAINLRPMITSIKDILTIRVIY